MTHPSKRGKLICSFVLLRCHEILIASLHHLCAVLTTAYTKNTLECQDLEIRVKMKVAQLNLDTSAAPDNERVEIKGELASYPVSIPSLRF